MSPCREVGRQRVLLERAAALPEVSGQHDRHLRVVGELARRPVERATAGHREEFGASPGDAGRRVELDRRADRIPDRETDQEPSRPVPEVLGDRHRQS